MDKKAIIRLWMLRPSDEVAYFLIPLPQRLEQLKAVVEAKRDQTASLYKLLKQQKENKHGS